MKKIFLIASLMTVGFISANAQFKIGIGPAVGLPIGDVSDISSFIVGVELQGEYKFSDKASGIVTTGYSHFLGKDLGGFKVNFGAIPILAGARVYPSEKFFIGGQIGYGFFSGDASGGGFAYKPHVGYDAGSVQLNLSYNGISNNGTFSWIGLAGVFKFGGGGEGKK